MGFQKPDKKFCLLIFLAFAGGFLGGVLLVAKGGVISAEKAGLFSDYYLYQYSYLDINRMDLTFLVAKERGKWLLLMWALGFTGTGVFFVYLFAGVWGFLGAVFVAQAYIKRGIAGIGLALLFGMPQLLIYVPLWLWFLYAVQKQSIVCGRMKRMGAANKDNRQYLFKLAAASVGLALGILTESYVNSWIVQQILRLI